MVDVPTTNADEPSDIATPLIVMPVAPALRVDFPFIRTRSLLLFLSSNGVNV